MSSTNRECRIAIIGGGMLGSAIGYGLARSGAEVTMLDQGDTNLRAARGNFGLLWVQGKGAQFPEYAHWTLKSTQLWPTFAAELLSLTGIDVQLYQRGGIHYCLDEGEQQDYALELKQQAAISNGLFDFQPLNNAQLRKREPNIGASVPGGVYSPNDGHVNPLYLLKAMQSAFIKLGGNYLPNHDVLDIKATADGYQIKSSQGEIFCEKIILAAGLNNTALAKMIDLEQPLHPQRGQLLITERLPKLLNFPSIYLRQTQEGGIQIGDSSESVGLDDSNTPQVMAALAKRAIKLLPALEHRSIIRGWAALRVLSPDGYPIYQHAQGNTKNTAPQAYALSCHSAVTLAAAHALELAPMIINDQFSQQMQSFDLSRLRQHPSIAV